MGSSSLHKPYRNFVLETNWLLDNLDNVLSRLKIFPLNVGEDRLSGEMTILCMHDAWSRFCRELIILSAASQPVTANGVRLPLAPNISKRQDVIPTLLALKNKSLEPKWYSARDCIDAARRLNLANYPTISTAIGASNSPEEDLRSVRNFFAHRWYGTASKIRTRSFYQPGTKLSLEDLVGRRIHPGITVAESWVRGLRLVAEAAIQ